MLCFASIDMKMRQSQIARWIELLADIILPMGQLNEDPAFYDFILDVRNRVIESERWNRITCRPRDVEATKTDFLYLFDVRRDLFYREDYNNQHFVDDFWVHGMSTIIAQAMDTSRQNVDRYMALGKIKESRTMDKTIYEFLGEEIWHIF